MGVLGGLALLGRWGSTSLAVAAGAQAIVGPAGWAGSATLVASSWCAAAALVLVAPAAWWPTLASGVLAADVVAGPAVVRTLDGANVGHGVLRIVAAGAAVAAARGAARWLPRRLSRGAALAAATAAVLLVLVG